MTRSQNILENWQTTRLNRRRFLYLAGGAAGLALASQLPLQTSLAAPKFNANPFTLGVASGDPLPRSVVLWTRLAPDPLNGGGMPVQMVPVEWELAADEGFKTVVQRGIEIATPDLGHAVHAEVLGLEPDRWYWYRFRAGSEISPVGRTRTLPAFAAAPPRMRFAFASCQNYSQGYYTAYAGMAEEDLDFVIHLGDYIYEGRGGAGTVRIHEGEGEPEDVVGYRNRYAQYRLDPNLQAAHAAFPFITTWDDHEVDNDYAGSYAQDFVDPNAFLERRAAAYQVYYEMLPLRRVSIPSGPDMQLYRGFQFGDLAAFSVLDTRQYRDDQACPTSTRGGGRLVDAEECPEIFDEARSILGAEQEQCLFEALDRSTARWNVIAQQLKMAELEESPGPGAAYWTDGWDGYWASRQRILDFITARRPANPVVISGDIHTYWVNDMLADFAQPDSAVIGSEFVGTSISSRGSDFSRFLPENPHIKYHEWRYRGYVRCEVDRALWRSDFRVVDSVETPDSPTWTLASWVVEDGKPGPQRDG